MSVTITTAVPCNPVFITLSSGFTYIKEFEITQANYDEMFDENDDLAEGFIPNYLDWNNDHAYRVLVSTGMMCQGGNIHMDVYMPKCVDVLRQCNAFLDACGNGGEWAIEFSNLRHPMTEMITKALTGDGGGARVIDCASDDPEGLIDRVTQLRDFCADALTNLGMNACLSIS